MVTPELIDAARRHIDEKLADGVLSFNPVGPARVLKIELELAIELLSHLQKTDGKIRIGGGVYCQQCQECVVVKGKTVSDIRQNSKRFIGKTCTTCDGEMACGDDLNLRIWFVRVT